MQFFAAVRRAIYTVFHNNFYRNPIAFIGITLLIFVISRLNFSEIQLRHVTQNSPNVLPLSCNNCVNITSFLTLIFTLLQDGFHHGRQSDDKIFEKKTNDTCKAFSIRVFYKVVVAKWRLKELTKKIVKTGPVSRRTDSLR